MHDDATAAARHDAPTAVPHRGTAQRPPWHALPDAVRAAVESHAGASVVSARSQDGGFTEGFASRLELADGRRVFVKAASAARGEHAHHAYGYSEA